MQRTFFYTQIKSNDFNLLKETCQPFSKDIFSADQEHIVAFDKSSNACKAAIKFLNQIRNLPEQSDYKIVLVQGDFTQDRPEELPVRVARSIHQHANPKNLYLTEEILNQIHASDIVFEPKNPLFVKALQKEIPTFTLSRFEESELQVDPTDLFDFSQVDSYSSMNQIKNTGQPVPPPKDPFESSNTTLELDPVRKKSIDTGKVNPYVTGPQQVSKGSGPQSPSKVTGPQSPVKTPPSRPTTARSQTSETKSQTKSVAIILVLLAIVTGAGVYLTRTKQNIAAQTEIAKPLPLPQIPPETPVTAEQGTTTPPPIIGTGPVPPIKQTSAATEKAAPLPQIAYIHIHSVPKGAAIWMNGKKLGHTTPLENLKVSTKEPILIEVQKAGYLKASKMLDLAPKETRTVAFTLSMPKGKSKPTTKKALKKK